MAARKQGSGKRKPGRPKTLGEPWSKATVVLTDRQIAQLDMLAVKIRAATGLAVTRGEIIRMLVDELLDAKVAPGKVAELDDLRAALRTRWGKTRR